MSESKFFQRGKIQELRAELNSDKKDSKHAKKKIVLKKIVANITMGNDMSPLFQDVIACMNIPLLEIKKMVYLYLISYSKSKPEMARMAVNYFVRDLGDGNPLIRALALRTMSYIHVDRIIECLCDNLKRLLNDRDPYVCKTAAICVAKLYAFDKSLVENFGFLDQLHGLIDHENATVVANAVAALSEMADRSESIDLGFEVNIANKLLTAMNECSEWGQAYILESLLRVVPQEHNDAELLVDRILPRLQHANSAVVLTAVRVILYFTNYIANNDLVESIYKKLGPPLVTLLHNGAEVQYVALRNILIILQKKPDFLKNDIRVFFCKYNDAIYVKLAKLEIICRLVADDTVEQVLSELKEYATEVDVDFVRKAVRSIGRCAIRIESAADKCVETLVELIKTKVNYVVQEAIVVIKDIFRKYPNRYESVIATLCENLDNLDEPEAKASMIWIIGQYSDRIENADELLEQFLETFKEENSEVQLAMLTAVIKLFIKRPSAGQDLVPRILKWSTEEVDNPDLRDRGFIYWRLLSTNPVAAKAIVLSEKPTISTEMDFVDPTVLDDLYMHISTLSSIYHRPPQTFIGNMHPKKLDHSSSAYVYRNFRRQNGDESGVTAAPSNQFNYNSYTTDVTPYNRPSFGLVDEAENAYDDDAYADIDQINSYDEMAIAANASMNPADKYLNDTPAFLDTSAASALQTSTPTTPVSKTLALMDPERIGPSSYTPISFTSTQPGQNSNTNQTPSTQINMLGQIPIPQINALQNQQTSTGGISANNPFGPKLANPTPFPDMLSSQPLPAPATNVMGVSQVPSSPSSSLLGTVNTSGKPTLDPFAMGSKGSDLVGKMGGLQLSDPAPNPFGVTPAAVSPPMPTSSAMIHSSPKSDVFVQPKYVFLTPDAGKGLGILGTFARRQGVLVMDLTLANRSPQIIQDFAVLFNKNSFGLVPAFPLNVPPLAPGGMTEASLVLKIDGPAVPSTPINNLQVALKCNLGILYFQTLVPLHVMFSEDGALPQSLWLKMWKEDVPPSNERLASLTVPRPLVAESVQARLVANNVFVVAQRSLEETHFFTSSKLVDGSVLLSEIKFAAASTAVTISTKTFAVQWSETYNSAIGALLNSI